MNNSINKDNSNSNIKKIINENINIYYYYIKL